MHHILTHQSARDYYRLAAAALLPLPYNSTASYCKDLAALLSRTHFKTAVLLRHALLPISKEAAQNAKSTPCEELIYKAIQDELDYELEKPLQFLVRPKKRCHKSHAYFYRSCNWELPQGSLYKLSANESIVSPELLFLQMAAQLVELHLVVAFGCELAGRYALLPKGLVSIAKQTQNTSSTTMKSTKPSHFDGYVECAGRTTASKLSEYIHQVESANSHITIPGLSIAKRALRYIKDGSRSPMETYCSVQLRLPRASGGFGASNAKFNVRINIDLSWQYILKKPYLVVDALFRARNAHTQRKCRDSVIEFNGRRWHGAHPQMNEDNLRRHALENAGYDVRFITGRDFYDFRTWNMIGESICYATGIFLRPASQKMMNKRRQVHRDFCNDECLR